MGQAFKSEVFKGPEILLKRWSALSNSSLGSYTESEKTVKGIGNYSIKIKI